MNKTNGKIGLVLGASGGLGSALLAELAQRADFSTVVGVSRAGQPLASHASHWFQANVVEPESLQALVESVAACCPRIDLLINCMGTLHGDETELRFAPEKALRQLRLDNFQHVMEINAFAPLAALEAFSPLLKRGATDQGSAVAAVLSAMVGSITDNRLGGWYSYRMSKAALNMGLRNVAIEYSRVKGAPTVVGIHPGTTLTALSEPFVSRHKHRSAVESARCILAVIDGLNDQDSGKFLNWDGLEIPF